MSLRRTAAVQPTPHETMMQPATSTTATTTPQQQQPRQQLVNPLQTQPTPAEQQTPQQQQQWEAQQSSVEPTTSTGATTTPVTGILIAKRSREDEPYVKYCLRYSSISIIKYNITTLIAPLYFTRIKDTFFFL